MKTKVGALLFGAAVLSLFLPKRRRPALPAAAHPPLPPPDLARRVYALVQTKPAVLVLAVSSQLKELEREVAELNETWNHWALRTERRRFEIQSTPVLVPTQSHRMRPREPAAPRR